MKRFLIPILLFIAFLLALNADAANTVTDHYTNSNECVLASDNWRKHAECGVEYKTVQFDTADTNVTVETPGSGEMTCVVDAKFSEGTAATVTFTSGSAEFLILEMAANQGSFNSGKPFCTQSGQALLVKSSVAFTSLMLRTINLEKIRLY